MTHAPNHAPDRAPSRDGRPGSVARRLLLALSLAPLCLAPLSLPSLVAVPAGLLAAAALPGPATAAEDADSYYEDALARYKTHDYEGAIVQLKNALQLRPGNLPARILLGQCHLTLGDGPAAERAFATAIKNGADEALVIRPLGESYLMQGKFRDLLERLQPGGRSNTVEAQILALRGEAYYNLQEYFEASREFRAATRLNPAALPPVLGLVRLAVRDGDFAKAEQLMASIEAAATDLPEFWVMRGDLNRYQGRVPDAIAAYNRVIGLQPFHLPALTRRAELLLDIGDFKRAKVDIDAIREKDPLDPFGAYYRSRLLFAAGDRAGGRANLREANLLLSNLSVEDLVTHPPLLFLSALLEFSKRDFEKARGRADLYVRREPRDPSGRKLLGDLLIRSGNAGQAVLTLKPVLDWVKDDAQLLMLLGAASMQLRHYTEATEYFEQATALRPDLARARSLQGVSLLASGEIASGTAALQEAVAADPGERRASLALLIVHLRERQFAEALAEAEKLIAEDPKNPVYHSYAGAALFGMDRLAEAREKFEQSLNLDPTYHSAAVNIAKLDQLAGGADAARKRYEKILAKDPHYEPALRGLALLAESRNDLKDAIAWREKMRNAKQGGLRSELRLVELYIRTEQPDKALTVAGEIADANKPTFTLLNTLAQAQIAANRYGDAKVTLARMDRLALDSVDRLLYVARLQAGINDLEGARRSLIRAIVTFPDNVDALVELAGVEARLGLVKPAMSRVKDLRDLRPDSALTEMLAGDVMMRNNHLDEAVDYYQKGLDKEPSAAMVARYYMANLRRGTPEKAFKRLEKWVRENPGDPVAERTLAGAYIRAGQPKQAIALHQKLLEQNAKDPALLNNLAWLYLGQDDPRARRTAEMARDLAPDNPRILDTLGWILVSGGNAQEGLAVLRGAHARDAANPTIRYHMAVALAKMGRLDEARREVEFVLQSDGDKRLLADARALQSKLGQ